MNYYVNKSLEYLIYLTPFLLLTGPALPDISATLCGLCFIYLTISNKDWKFYKSKIVIFFFIFSFYLILNSSLSNNIIHSYENSLFYIRFIFFALAIWYALVKFPNLTSKLFIIFTVIFIFLILDSLIQFYLGYDIFLIEYRASNRITSVFGQESILGSFLIRFLPIYISLLIFKNNKKNINLFFFLILIVFCLVIFTGERSSIVMLFILNLLILFFVRGYVLQKIIILLTPLIILITISFISDKFFERLINRTTVEIYGFYNNSIELSDPSDSASKLPSYRFTIYQNALELFKSEPLLGVGPKNFRIECKRFEKEYKNVRLNDKLEDPKIGCSTHPHNNYIQLLSETGIIGTVPIIFIYFFTIYKLFYYSYYNKNDDVNYSNIIILTLFSFIVNFFPFMPTGSFFNNWLNVMYYFVLGYLLFVLNRKFI